MRQNMNLNECFFDWPGVSAGDFDFRPHFKVGLTPQLEHLLRLSSLPLDLVHRLSEK